MKVCNKYTYKYRSYKLLFIGRDIPPHSTLGTSLNSTVAPYVELVYKKLSTKELLDSCKKKAHKMPMNAYIILCRHSVQRYKNHYKTLFIYL